MNYLPFGATSAFTLERGLSFVVAFLHHNGPTCLTAHLIRAPRSWQLLGATGCHLCCMSFLFVCSHAFPLIRATLYLLTFFRLSPCRNVPPSSVSAPCSYLHSNRQLPRPPPCPGKPRRWLVYPEHTWFCSALQRHYLYQHSQANYGPSWFNKTLMPNNDKGSMYQIGLPPLGPGLGPRGHRVG